MEIMVVAIIALVVFGPEKLPEIARTLGRYASELRRVAGEVRSEFEFGLDDVEDEKPAPKPRKPLTTRSDPTDATSEGDGASTPEEDGAPGAESAPGAEPAADPAATTDTPLARGIDPRPRRSGNGSTPTDPEA
jgi:TatA/E family protein of Tat protein translocase